MPYSPTLQIHRLICRDTESIHSSDKLALTGAVRTDVDSASIYFPMRRINDGETWEINQNFPLRANLPHVGVALLGFDLDENDSWTENVDEIKAIHQGITTVVSAIHAAGGAIGGAVGSAVIEAVNAFNNWDKNDKLIDFTKDVDLSSGAMFQTHTVDLSADFKKDGFVGYSSWNYRLEMTLEYMHYESFGSTWPNDFDPNKDEHLLAEFRRRADEASKRGCPGAFPNFYYGRRGLNHVAGTIFLNGRGSEWRDIKLSELGYPDLNDFGERMRRTQAWATEHGFISGFPNGYHAGTGADTVCGTILLGHDAAEWRDIPLTQLGSPALDDVGARFRGTQDWAKGNGFEGGYPNMFHADYPHGRVAGTVLIKPDAGYWDDVVVATDPR